MPIHDNTNRGVLFKNLDKEDSKHADFNGNLNVNGKEFWLNAWSRTSKNGVKYLSLSIKPKEAPKAAMAKPAAKQSGGAQVPFDDDVPFLPERRG